FHHPIPPLFPYTTLFRSAIAEALAGVGVDRIEAGMPAVSDDDFEAVRQITKLGLPSKIYTFVRAIAADIDKSLEGGARGVILEIPIGYPKLLWQFNWTWEDVLSKRVEIVRYAKGHDVEVVYLPYDRTHGHCRPRGADRRSSRA